MKKHKLMKASDLSDIIKKLKQEKKQWKSEWDSIAEANAAGYNECHKRYEKLLRFIILKHPTVIKEYLDTIKDEVIDQIFKDIRNKNDIG